MRLFPFPFARKQEPQRETVTIPREAFVDLMEKVFQAGGAIREASGCMQADLEKRRGRTYRCLGEPHTAAELNRLIHAFSDDLNRRSCDFFQQYYLEK